MFYLNNNVYFVKGHTAGIIYDFNQESLFHVSLDVIQLIEKCKCPTAIFTSEETAFLDELLQEQILTKQYVKPHDISELSYIPEIDFVWIEVTSQCNLKCIHCYDESSPFCDKVMPYKEFCHIIDELQQYGIRKMQIIGGEPFILGRKLQSYLDYCIGKFDYLEIFTNGTLIDDVWISYLKENNIHIALSVYSYDRQEHNHVTQSNTAFDRTNFAIQKLYDASIPYRVKNVLMSGISQGTPNTALYKLSPHRDIVRMTGRANLSLLDRNLLRKKLITEDTFSGKVNQSLIARILSGHNCFARRLYFSVDSEVYPCVMERRISHGNLKGHTLSDIIQPQICTFGKDHIKECKDCEFRYSCFDCRPDSLGQAIDEKPWYCTYQPLTGVWLDSEKYMDKILPSE